MTTLNSGTNWSPRLAIYGDMGSTNARSLPKLMSEIDAGNFDAILHVGMSVELTFTSSFIQPYFIAGDFAYDLATVCQIMSNINNAIILASNCKILLTLNINTNQNSLIVQ